MQKYSILVLLFILGTWASAQDRSDAPSLVMQTSHVGPVDSVAFSKDGSTLASTSTDSVFGDHTVRLWNVETGQSLRTLRGHSGFGASNLVFTPDGRTLLSASDNPLLIQWDIKTGERLSVRPEPTGPAMLGAIAFNFDGTTVAFTHGNAYAKDKSDHSIKVTDLRTNNVRVFVRHSAVVQSLVFSSDGRRLYSGSEDKTIIEWDVSSGKPKRILIGSQMPVRGLDISPDGKWLASIQLKLPFESFREDTTPILTIWNLATGKPIDSFAGYMSPVRFSPRGDKLAVADAATKSLVLIDMTDRSRRIPVAVAAPLKAVAFHPNKDLIGVACETEVSIIDLRDLSQKTVLGGSVEQVYSATISPSENLLATGAFGGSINLWNLQRGFQLSTLAGHRDRVYGLKFRGETELWSVSIDNSLRVWDISGQKPIGSILLADEYISRLAASEDGRRIVTSHANFAGMWNGAVRQLEQKIRDEGNQFNVAAIRNDGTFIAIGNWDGTVSLWDLGGEPTRVWHGPITKQETPEQKKYREAWSVPPPIQLPAPDQFATGEPVTALAFSNDHKLIAVGGAESKSKIKILDSLTGEQKLVLTGHERLIKSINFSPDSKRLVSGSWDYTAKVWDTNTGKCLFTLSGHNSEISTAFFIFGGTKILTASQDGTIKIWDADTGVSQITFISVRSSGSLQGRPDWVVVTDDGLFDGTPEALRNVGWRIPSTNEVIPLESLYNDFYYPGLLMAVLSGSSPKADYDLAARLRFPSLRTMAQQGLAHIQQKEDKTYLCLTQAASPADNENLQVLGRGDRIDLTKAFVKDPEDARCSYRMELPKDGGPYELVGKADGWRLNGNKTLEPATQSSVNNSILHVLTVGIDKYSRNYGPLRFPVADADAVDDFFSKQKTTAKKVYADIHIWQGLRDESATQNGIRNRLSEMALNMKEDDVVFIFLSGHGRVPPGQSMFYFIPYAPKPKDSWEVKPLNEREEGFSTAMLAEAIRNLPARRVVLVVDACQSGGAVESLGKVAEVKLAIERGRAAQEKRGDNSQNVGVYILAAATPVQEAGEPVPGKAPDNLKHGLLTTALLEALQGTVATSDGKVWMRTVMDHVIRRVPELAEEVSKGKPKKWVQTAFPVRVGRADFPLAVR